MTTVPAKPPQLDDASTTLKKVDATFVPPRAVQAAYVKLAMAWITKNQPDKAAGVLQLLKASPNAKRGKDLPAVSLKQLSDEFADQQRQEAEEAARVAAELEAAHAARLAAASTADVLPPPVDKSVAGTGSVSSATSVADAGIEGVGVGEGEGEGDSAAAADMSLVVETAYRSVMSSFASQVSLFNGAVACVRITRVFGARRAGWLRRWRLLGTSKPFGSSETSTHQLLRRR